MPPNKSLPTEMTAGGKLVQDVLGKRTRLTRYDRVMLTVRIDGLLRIAVGNERHRCFDIVRDAMACMTEAPVKLINQVTVLPLKPVRIVVNREDRKAREDWKRTRDQCS